MAERRRRPSSMVCLTPLPSTLLTPRQLFPTRAHIPADCFLRQNPLWKPQISTSHVTHYRKQHFCQSRWTQAPNPLTSLQSPPEVLRADSQLTPPSVPSTTPSKRLHCNRPLDVLEGADCRRSFYHLLETPSARCLTPYCLLCL